MHDRGGCVWGLGSQHGQHALHLAPKVEAVVHKAADQGQVQALALQARDGLHLRLLRRHMKPVRQGTRTVL